VRVLERAERDANCDQLFWAGNVGFGSHDRGQNRKSSESANAFCFAPLQRSSMRRLRPTSQPACCKPCSNAATRVWPIASSAPTVISPSSHPLDLLRARRERPCHRRAAEQRYERAPSHSITSSARASSVGGTSRPSALAVFRLTTSSYLVGACTGRSAGF